MLGKNSNVNTTLSTEAAAGLIVSQDDALDRAITSIVGRRGLIHWVDPANRVAGGILDKVDASLWAFEGGSADPVASTISGRAALRYTHGVSRHLRSTAMKPVGSFSILCVFQQGADDITPNVPRMLFASGGSTGGDLMHARWEPAGSSILHWIGNNGPSGGDLSVERGIGFTNGMFCYDGETGEASIFDHDNNQLTGGPMPGPIPSGWAWEIGGWGSTPGYTFVGDIGPTLFFNQAYSRPSSASIRSQLLAATKEAYGFS